MSSIYNVNVLYTRSHAYISFIKNNLVSWNFVHCCRIHSAVSKKARHPGIPRRKRLQDTSYMIDESKEKDFLKQMMTNDGKKYDGEQLIQMPYGDIRFDVQNKPSYSPRSPSERTRPQQYIEASDTSNAKKNVTVSSHLLHTHRMETGGESLAVHKLNRKSKAVYGNTVVRNDDQNRSSVASSRISEVHSAKDNLQNWSDSPSDSGPNYFDKQYFENVESQKNELQQNHVNSEQNLEFRSQNTGANVAESQVADDGNYFDEQYFGDEGSLGTVKHRNTFTEKLQNVDRTFSVGHSQEYLHGNGKEKCSTKESFNLFDEQYFPREGCNSSNEDVAHSQHDDISLTGAEQDSIKDKDHHHKNDLQQNMLGEKIPQKDKGQNISQEKDSHVIRNHEASSVSPKSTVEQDGLAKNKKSALDVVKEMRQQRYKSKEVETASIKMTARQLDANPWAKTWDGKVDSRGFRVLSNQIPDLKHHLEDDIVHLLKHRIIYEDGDIVAIDKPYGLASHGGPGVHHSVGRVLGPLSKKISKTLETLYLVHRLDKETTGVMLLAKNDTTARRLVEIFKKRQVIKKYWVITKGVPVPEEGVIDIPIGEGTVQGKHRMALRPHYPKEMKILYKGTRWRSKGREAITNFKVLSKYMSLALVECQPESGVKHQIRCHLAFGLNTPILGDHKYSHLSKIAPQKLHPDILQRLGIRQAKVRTLPMHLHAKTIVLPEFRDGRNLFIHADLPKYFKQNMKWLKIKMPE